MDALKQIGAQDMIEVYLDGGIRRGTGSLLHRFRLLMFIQIYSRHLRSGRGRWE